MPTHVPLEFRQPRWCPGQAFVQTLVPIIAREQLGQGQGAAAVHPAFTQHEVLQRSSQVLGGGPGGNNDGAGASVPGIGMAGGAGDHALERLEVGDDEETGATGADHLSSGGRRTRSRSARA